MRSRDLSSSYLSNDTIAAISTALGGPISIVRLSGPSASEILGKIAGPSARTCEPKKFHLGKLSDLGTRVIDEALYVRFVAPESFTGEDLVEFHIHGSAFIATRLLETLIAGGARQALPGEFSFRAVRNGKMTLSQAQAVSDLIAASNDNAVSLALEKLSGSQNQLISELGEALRETAVLAEAGIDFSDQDLDEVSLPALKARLEPVLVTLKNLAQSFDRGLRIQEGVKVAFLGLPNAGKSSFFNALLGEDRSIVSETPGTTRDLVREHITLRGRHTSVTLRLEDTAGLRQTQNKIEREGISRTVQAARDSDLILWIVDAPELILSSQFAAVRDQWVQLGSPKDKTIGILTKVDLLASGELHKVQQSCSELAIQTWVPTSARNGVGISEAVQAVTNFCERWLHRKKGEVVLTHLDQVRAAQSAIQHLERAIEAHESDLFASDLKQTLHALGPLIGTTLPEDILGRIFSNFCIGK